MTRLTFAASPPVLGACLVKLSPYYALLTSRMLIILEYSDLCYSFVHRVQLLCNICRVGQNHIHTVYVTLNGRGFTKYSVIYGVYIRFWPTPNICHCKFLTLTPLPFSIALPLICPHAVFQSFTYNQVAAKLHTKRMGFPSCPPSNLFPFYVKMLHLQPGGRQATHQAHGLPFIPPSNLFLSFSMSKCFTYN